MCLVAVLVVLPLYSPAWFVLNYHYVIHKLKINKSYHVTVVKYCLVGLYLYQKSHFYNQIVKIPKNKIGHSSCNSWRPNINVKLRKKQSSKTLWLMLLDHIYIRSILVFIFFLPPSSSCRGYNELQVLDPPSKPSFQHSVSQSMILWRYEGWVWSASFDMHHHHPQNSVTMGALPMEFSAYSTMLDCT